MYNDNDIANAIADKLNSNDIIENSSILIDVSNHVVTLRGVVDSMWKKNQLEIYASEIDDVEDVVNDVAVVLTNERSDMDIAKDIELELEDAISEDVDELDIIVENGNVSLSGNLKSWSIRDEILNAVSRVHGIREIEDNLIVRDQGLF